MALTYILTSSSYDGRYLQVVCSQNPNPSANTSTIYWTLRAVGGSVNYYTTGPTTLVINGNTVYSKERTKWESETFPAAKGSVSGSFVVSHGDDGSLTVPMSLSTAIYSTNVKTVDASWELDPIARGAMLTTAPPTFTATDLPTIQYTNPLGDGAYKVEVCIADANGIGVLVPYQELDKTGTTYTFKASDVALLNRYVASNGKRLSVMFVIHTVRTGGQEYHHGLPSTYEMVETDDTKPKVTMTLAVNNPNTFSSSLANTYIQGKSRVTATLSTEFKYNATPTGYSLNVGGAVKSISSNANTITITSEEITKQGDNIAVIGSAVDSREITGTATQNITVYYHSRPLVTNIASENAIQCYRSDGQKNPLGNSTSVCIKARRSYYDLGGNNRCALKWRRRLSTEAWDDSRHLWDDLIQSTNTNPEAEYDALVVGVFALDKSYAIQIMAIDDTGEHDIRDLDVPTQEVALHLGKGGKNVSIGEFCDTTEPHTFRSAWKAIFDKGVVDRQDKGWVDINSHVRYRYSLGRVTIVGISNEDIALTSGQYTTVGTIPAEYAPSTKIPLVYHGVGASIPGQAGYVETDGSIQLYTNVGGVSYWAFTVTYPI